MARETNPTISVVANDWTDLKQLGIPSDAMARLGDRISVGKLKIDLEVLLPPGADKESAEQGAQKVCRDYRKRIRESLRETIVQSAELLKTSDDDGGRIASAAKALNKHIEDLLKEFRADLRKGIARELNDSSKGSDLQTIGSTKFAGISAGEEEFDPAAALADKELQSGIKRKGWQCCGVAWNAKTARLSIGTKEPGKSELKSLEGLVPEGAKGSAAGKVNAFTPGKLSFEFLKGSGVKDKALEKALKTGLEDQLGKKPSYVEVLVVPAYSEPDTKKKKEEEKEGKDSAKGKTTASRKEAKPDKGAKKGPPKKK